MRLKKLLNQYIISKHDIMEKYLNNPEELRDKLKIRGLTVKRIEDCKNVILGKTLI